MHLNFTAFLERTFRKFAAVNCNTSVKKNIKLRKLLTQIRILVSLTSFAHVNFNAKP